MRICSHNCFRQVALAPEIIQWCPVCGALRSLAGSQTWVHPSVTALETGVIDSFPKLTRERIAQGLTSEWTAEDRLLAIAALLPGMQDDIYMSRYSAPGRPNVTSLQHIMNESADVLEAQNIRQELAALVKKLEY